MDNNKKFENGTVLDKLGVFQVITEGMNNASNEELCHIFEVCHGNREDMRLRYDKKEDLFIVYEGQNYN